MQDVEATVSEHNAFVVGTGIINRQQQLFQAQHATLRAFGTLDRPAQFRRTDGRGAQFADHNARRQIGQGHGVGQFFTGRNGRRQGGNHRITGTGDIKHFTGARRQVHRRVARAQQGHAVLATGNQQGPQVEVSHQRGALGHQFVLIGATADNGFELTEVWRDQAGAPINREVLALRIGQHRNVAGLGGLDQFLMVLQGAFAVVGQDQHLDAFEQRVNLTAQGQGVGGEGFFEIDTQQLLVTAHDPQLDDGRLMGNALEQRAHASTAQAVGQAVGGFVVAGHTDQGGRGAERGNIEGNVGSATWTVFDLLDLNYRYRCLRGNP